MPQHGLRRRSAVVATVFLVVVMAATLLTSTPAGATKFEGGHYEGTDSFSYSFCGFVVEVDVTFHGVYSLRTGKGAKESAFFLHDKYWYTETHSANGLFFTISGNGLFQETRAVPLGGNLFEFHAIDAGQPFVVRGMDGEVLLRDRGVIRQTVVFDTLGDGVPGGVLVEEGPTQIAGPHPGFFIDPLEACPLLTPSP